MYEKYLNKEVKVIVQVLGTNITYSKKGRVTDFNEKSIELDNNNLINCFSVVEVIIK